MQNTPVHYPTPESDNVRLRQLVPRLVLLAGTVFLGLNVLRFFGRGLVSGISFEPSEVDDARSHLGGSLARWALLIGLCALVTCVLVVTSLVRLENRGVFVAAIVVFAIALAAFVPATRQSQRVNCARAAQTVDEVSAC